MLIARYGHNGTMGRGDECAVLGAVEVRYPTGIAAPHGVWDGVAARMFQAENMPHLVRDDVGLFMRGAHSEAHFIHDYLTLNPFRLATATTRKRPGVPMLDVYKDRLDGSAKGRKRSKNQREDVGSHAPDPTAPCQARGPGVR